MPGIEWVNTVDNSSFIRSMNEMVSQIRQTQAVIEAMGEDASSVLDKMNSAGNAFKGTLKEIASLAGVAFSLGQVKSFMGKVAETRAYFQDIESSMKVFLGNEERAADFTKKLKDYAYFNMFDFAKLADASKQMIAYGHSVDSIIPRLDQLSNVARGTNVPLMEMVNSYNKAKNLGGLDGKDLQSWAAKGLIVRDILKDMGEQVNGSRVSFEQFNKVLDKVTGEGGMFHNLMGEQMTNISAEQGQLEDNLDAMYNKIGEKYEDVIVKWYKMQSAIAEGITENPITNWGLDLGADVSEYLVDHYQEIAKALASLIGTYGEYRATLALTRAYENVKSKSVANEEIKLLDEEIQKYKELMPAKEAAKNADLTEAVAKRQLTEEDAKRIAAKRAELEQVQIDSQLVKTNEEILRLKTLKLDEDLQEKVASEQLTLAQAQEVQSRRAVLEQLEKEIKARKENTLAKLEEQIDKNDAEIAMNKTGIANDNAALERTDKELRMLDERIAKSEQWGATEEEINKLRERRNEIIEKQEGIVEDIVRQESEIERLRKENADLGAAQRDAVMRYGSVEERADAIREEKQVQEELLKTTQEKLQNATYEYAQTQVRSKELRDELETMREQLRTQQQINQERSEQGKAPETPKYTEADVDLKQKELQVALEEENAAAVAKEEIAEKAEAIQEKINNLTEQENTIITGANSVAKKGNTVATQQLTLQEKLHTIATAAGTKVTKIFTTMIGQARMAMNGLKTAIMTNPLGIFIGAVTMALPWIMEWISGTDDAADAASQYGNEAREAASKAESLFSVIDVAKEGTKAYGDAVRDLASLYEEYGIEIEKTKDANGREIASVDSMKEHHDELIAKLRKEAIERQRLNDIKMAEDSYGEGSKKALHTMEKQLSGDFSSSEIAQIPNLVEDSEIEKLAELQRKMDGLQQGTKEWGLAVQEYNAMSGPLIERIENYGKALGKDDDVLKNLVFQTHHFIGALVSEKAELQAAKEAADAAAKAARGNLQGEADLTKKKEEVKAVQTEISELFNKIADLDKAKANPEVKVEGTEESKENVEDTNEKIDELNGKQATMSVDSEDVKAAVNDTLDAIDQLQILADEEAIPEVDTEDILKAIDDSNDAVAAVDSLDLSEADPTVRKEQIEAAMTRTENAISALEQLDVTKAAPGVDLTGYNATLEKLRNIKNMLLSIAGVEVGEGEIQVNGKGKGSNFFGNLIGGGRDKLNKTASDPKVLRAALENRKKKYEEWFKEAHTEQQIKEFIAEIDKEQANFTTTSEGYQYYQGLKDRAQATTGKGMASAAKKRQKDAESARKKAAQEAKKAATEAERKANEQRKAEEREAEESRRYDLEQAKLKRDREYAIEQERIDQMAKGSAKERAQAAFDHKKRLDQIKEQERELLQKEIDHQKKLYEADTKNKSARGFYARGLDKNVKLTEEQRSGVVAETSSENAKWRQTQEEWMEADAAAMRNLLKEYGSYEQKRLAITEEYAEKIRKASTPAEAAGFELERNEQLEKMRDKNFAEMIDWGGVFSSLEGHTKEYLEGLRENLQRLLDTGNLPIDQMSVIQGKLREINSAISKQGTMFEFIGDKTREHNRLLQESKDAQEELNKATAEQSSRNFQVFQAQEAIKTFGQSIGADVSGPMDMSMLDQFEEGSEEYKQMETLLRSLFVAEGNLEKARQRTAKATIKAKNAEDAAAEDTADMIARKFADAAQWVNTYLGDLPDLLKEVGLGDLGDKASGVISGINDAADAAADFASGNYVGAAMKGISAIKGIGESLGAWSSSNRADIEKENAKLATAMSVNSEAVNRLTEEMAKQSPTEAFKSFEMAVGALEANEQAMRQTMINNANMYDGGHSLRYDLNDTYVNKIADYLGLNRRGMSWNIVDLLRNTTAEQLNSLYKTTEGQDLLKGLGMAIGEAEDDGNYSGLFQDLLSYMNEFSQDAYDQLHNTLQEAITGVSFDSFKGGFLSSLMDMNKKASDFANDFTQQLMSSVLNARIQELFGDEIQSLYDAWGEAFDGDNTLTEEEVKALQAAQDDLTKRMLATRDELAKVTGYKDSFFEQSASQKGWQSMGQETADELNGRFTALQIAGEHISMNTDLIVTNLNNMAMMSEGNNTAIAEMRDMFITANSYLEDVVKYAKLTYNEFGIKIDTINQHQEEIYNAIRRT